MPKFILSLLIVVCVTVFAFYEYTFLKSENGKQSAAISGQVATSTADQNQAQASESYGTTTWQDFSTHTEGQSGGLNYNINAKGNFSTQTTCGTEDCFEKKFAACQPAKMKASLTEGLTYEYSIIGPKGGYCQVTSRFLANPNPEWIGKIMTCLYKNSVSFQTAVQDYSRCSGPLAELMFHPKIDTVEPTPVKNNSDPFDPLPPMRTGMSDEMILSKGQSTINGLEFNVSKVTSNSVVMTVTDHLKNQSEAVTLSLDQQRRVVGRDMVIVSIKYVRTGEMNGQATGEYYAVVEYN